MMTPFWRLGLSALSPPGKFGRLQIFSYHRVIPAPDEVFVGDPTCAEFRNQICWINDTCNVLHLSEAVSRLKTGSLPARAAAITFDDGYQNNIVHALPILEEYQVPATIFLATGVMVEGIMWNDLLIEGLRECTKEFPFLIGEETLEISKATSANDLLEKFKYLDHAERTRKSREFYEMAAGGPPPRQMLDPAAVADVRSNLIEFGAHTVSHPILSQLSDEESRREIAESKQQVEQWWNRPISLFAYPNGRFKQDFGSREMRFVAECGFQAAVATDWGVANKSSSLFALPRYIPWETEQTGFKARILKTNLARQSTAQIASSCALNQASSMARSQTK